MTIELVMPRYVGAKPLAGGRLAFYWTCPTAYRKAGFPIKAKPLGICATQAELDRAAEGPNAALDEWRHQRNTSQPAKPIAEYGTVDWLFRRYQREDCFLQRVDVPNRPDYERAFARLSALKMRSGRSFGAVPIADVTVAMASGIYRKLADTGHLRGAEKALMYAGTAWRRMRPLVPSVFSPDGNPWDGVTKRRRESKVKDAVGREEVYRFATGALALGHPQCAAAAVICFEWLMRPRNVAAGLLTWNDYRGKADATGIRIRHKKNRQTRIHPLELADDVAPILLYAEAEEILRQVPRWGLSPVCKPDGTVYGETTSSLTQLVGRVARKLEMPGFTLDACRHGGMTELEESALTDGQGRALSGHVTSRSYSGYAKETAERMLQATLRRRESRLAILHDDDDMTHRALPTSALAPRNGRANGRMRRL